MDTATPTPPGALAHQDDRLLTLDDVSAYTGIAKQTFYNWRTEGKGPRAIRLGKHLRFRRSAVDAWLEQHADAV